MRESKNVVLRKYPFPYQSMLAICSDLDETPDKKIYFETSKFLNTTKKTIIGDGVGLEVGNTIYFDMPEDQFSYSNTDKDGRAKIHELIKSGHIDCIHSFGDYVESRERAKECLELLKSNDCFIEVWVDHARAPTNIDSDILFGKGNIPSSPCYIADLISDYGIKYIWKGRVTSIAAQNSKHSYEGILDVNNLSVSIKTLLKEYVKYILSKLGNKKYHMHKNNRLLSTFVLSNGIKMYEFMRTNPSYAGVSSFDNADGVPMVIRKKFLNQLVKMQGCSVLYTHLGKVDSRKQPFTEKTKSAFKLLASYYTSGHILVTTTRRLLGYQRTFSELSYKVQQSNNIINIDLQTEYTARDLEGLTWYIPDSHEVNLVINGVRTDVVYNENDYTGRKSISLPWSKLVYPEII